MKIISKCRDYYDHQVSRWGCDELVVYDRRECDVIDTSKISGSNLNIELWFKNEVISHIDNVRTPIMKWKTKKVLSYKEHHEETKDLSPSKSWKLDRKEILEGDVYHFMLEVGYHHYIFEVERYIDDNDKNMLHMNYGLVEHKRIEKKDKISNVPMALIPIKYEKHYWPYKNDGSFVISKIYRDEIIDNPILAKTYIPKFLPPYDVWCNLYEYISSLRDKEFVDSRTNEQHIESNGFDKKTSFRHRKAK